MTNLHAPVLSDDELAAYREHGYVRLGKVAPDKEIAALCGRIDDIMLGKIRYDKMLMQLCPSAVGIKRVNSERDRDLLPTISSVGATSRSRS